MMTRAALIRSYSPEQPVQPGDADVVDPLDLVAEHVRGDAGLLGDGDVRGSGRQDHDPAFPGRGGMLLEENGPGRGVVVHLGKGFFHFPVGRFAHPRDQEVPPFFTISRAILRICASVLPRP